MGGGASAAGYLDLERWLINQGWHMTRKQHFDPCRIPIHSDVLALHRDIRECGSARWRGSMAEVVTLWLFTLLMLPCGEGGVT